MIIASIDIGTNTVLLLIAKVLPGGELKVLSNAYRIPRIGKHLIPGGNISDEKRDELFNVMGEYADIIQKFNCDKVLAVATNAFRIAANSKEITDGVKQKFQIEIKTITGEEEALLSYLGAINTYGADESNLVIDIGGGSIEIIYGTVENMIFRKSFPVGVVGLSEMFTSNNTFDKESFNAFLLQNIKGLRDLQLAAPINSIAVAGTPTTLAAIKKNLLSFDEENVEGTILTKKDIEKIAGDLEKMKHDEIKERYKSVVAGREDLILTGSYILLSIMELLDLPDVIVSTKGLRYGMIYKYIKTQ